MELNMTGDLQSRGSGAHPQKLHYQKSGTFDGVANKICVLPL